MGAIAQVNANVRHNITFMPNGGEGNSSFMQIQQGATRQLYTNVFRRLGFSFRGWALSPDSTIVEYANNAQITCRGRSFNLYAVWQGNLNQIFLVANGGSGSATPIQARTGEVITIPQNPFTRTGFAFLGWSSRSNVSVNGVVEFVPGAQFTMATNDIQLFAVWGHTCVWRLNGYDNGNCGGVRTIWEICNVMSCREQRTRTEANTFTHTRINWGEQLSTFFYTGRSPYVRCGRQGCNHFHSRGGRETPKRTPNRPALRTSGNRRVRVTAPRIPLATRYQFQFRRVGTRRWRNGGTQNGRTRNLRLTRNNYEIRFRPIRVVNTQPTINGNWSRSRRIRVR